jgi:hypothetical protein
MRFQFLLPYFLFALSASSQRYEIEEVKLVASIQTINGINEKSSDFAPVIFNNKIYFTSTRPYNLQNLGENNWDKNGFTNLFYGSFYLKEAGIKLWIIMLMFSHLQMIEWKDVSFLLGKQFHLFTI